MTTETITPITPITPTIPSFTHVIDPTLRAVLEGTLLPMPSILAPCVSMTIAAVRLDAHNDDIGFALLAARANAAGEAAAALTANEVDATLDALRRFWSM
jgi:hypothetical protein